MSYRHNLIAPLSKYEPFYIDRSFARGLKKDGIDLDFDPLILP